MVSKDEMIKMGLDPEGALEITDPLLQLADPDLVFQNDGFHLLQLGHQLVHSLDLGSSQSRGLGLRWRRWGALFGAATSFRLFGRRFLQQIRFRLLHLLRPYFCLCALLLGLVSFFQGNL